jgi:hypothetical protein
MTPRTFLILNAFFFSHTHVHAKAGKFRRLVGTMSPMDLSSDEAEIYVEGKLYMVEGFIRWCQRSKVGLNQIITVKDVYEEEPTGMYDDFYAPTTGSTTTN